MPVVKIAFRVVLFIVFVFCLFFGINAFRIYSYSSEFFDDESDVAVVLGAGTKEGQISPVFRERINHAINLYQNKRVGKLIFTGGIGEGQMKSDSRLAMEFAMLHGVSEKDILIDEVSKYTIQNLQESQKLMKVYGLKTVLLVSDPLHMKRSVDLAHKLGIDCKPSPTPTTMYRSLPSKLNQLMYECFYFTGGALMGKN